VVEKQVIMAAFNYFTGVFGENGRVLDAHTRGRVK
jgi:hypothetical protein